MLPFATRIPAGWVVGLLGLTMFIFLTLVLLPDEVGRETGFLCGYMSAGLFKNGGSLFKFNYIPNILKFGISSFLFLLSRSISLL